MEEKKLRNVGESFMRTVFYDVITFANNVTEQKWIQ